MENSRRQGLACIRGVLLVAFMGVLSGCALMERPRVDPIPVRINGDVATADRVYVLLPGMGDDLDSFDDHGFVGIARKTLGGRERVAFVAVDAHIGYYRDGELFGRIKDQVVGRYLAGKRITAVGISLGGLGALSTARRHPRLFERLVLIAPFLGGRGYISRLKNGSPPAGDELERELNKVWRWLSNGAGGLPIVVLYGRDDRFGNAYQLLAERAPGIAMHHIDGKHDWPTWNTLWGQWLARR
jgi:hypothetical protein